MFRVPLPPPSATDAVRSKWASTKEKLRGVLDLHSYRNRHVVATEDGGANTAQGSIIAKEVRTSAWTLTYKNLLIIVVRHAGATTLRALVIPLLVMIFLSFARNLFVPDATFGVGYINPIRSLPDALGVAVGVERTKLVFVNSGFTGGSIDQVIQNLTTVVRQGHPTTEIHVVETDAELADICVSSLRGVTHCYGAVQFLSSPSEGPYGAWTYVIRSDGALDNGKLNVKTNTNDGQIYILPLQKAVDDAIVSLNSTATQLPDSVMEYPFTALSQAQRSEEIRSIYQGALINYLGVAFIAGMVGVCYHLTGFMATERELGLSTLIEAMMPTRKTWTAQAARLLSYHWTFSMVYLPGWIIGSLILWAGVFKSSNPLLVLILHILTGLALTSMAILGASIFKKAQLSGVSVTLSIILLAILAQSLTSPKTGTVVILSLLFTPCSYVYSIHFLAYSQAQSLGANIGKNPPNSPWHIPGIVFWLFLVLQILVYPLIGAYVERKLYGTATEGRNVTFSADESPDTGAVRLDGFTKIYGGPRSRKPLSSGLSQSWKRLLPSKIRLFFQPLSAKLTLFFQRPIFSKLRLTSRRPWLSKPSVSSRRPPFTGLRQFLNRPIFAKITTLLKRIPRPEKREPVVAVNELSLVAGRGQILALLGANGSGKSTTLDAIAGTSRLTSGSITVDGTGGLGIAPQKNVLWDELTVEEHIRVFNRLKAPNSRASKAENLELIKSVDLGKKIKARSKTLSGGQKRKLQLGMMLTGGSAVCCVDEVSSGLDPLSRRKIWDILLAERGRRTIIMTTHFLDEADLLADHIAILSKGQLRAEGSSVVLKDQLGGGYRVRLNAIGDKIETPDIPGVEKHVAFDTVVYVAPNSALAAEVIRVLEHQGFHDYGFSGPTIEDVFLRLAEEIKGEEFKTAYDNRVVSPDSMAAEKNYRDSDSSFVKADETKELGLHKAVRINYFQQMRVLLRKRWTVLRHNWFPYFAAFAIPVIAAALVVLFVRKQPAAGCDPSTQGSNETPISAYIDGTISDILVGPSGPLAQRFETTIPSLVVLQPLDYVANLLKVQVQVVDTFDHFKDAVVLNGFNYTPGGVWLGDSSKNPTLAVKQSGQTLYGLEIEDSITALNMLDITLSNMTLNVTFASFEIPWSPDTGKSLQLLLYMGLVMAAFPGFFALYPNIERRQNVRGLEYSNGVQPLPLWVAYTLFDWSIVIVSMALVTIIFAAGSKVWYHVGYLFIIFVLYGLAAIQLGYVVSLFSANQLSTYAIVAASQAVMLLVYIIAYLATITYAPVNTIDADLLLVNWIVSIFAPICSVVRALFLALNLFSSTCSGRQLAPKPGGIAQYGGPISYLIVQIIFLFILLVWLDSGDVGGSLKRLFARRRKSDINEKSGIEDTEVASELTRVTSKVDGPNSASTDGLQVVHLTKTFAKNTAVDNVTFGIQRGEVFALLGPNGAGKSTTISLIRGDIKPSGRSGGDIFVENVSVSKHLADARAHLGVCPQFDAIDQMTVREHLAFYAGVRGIKAVDHQVTAILRAVGLGAFADRMAADLSGGNKRKLSLGIALMGNPTVVLLDEPSSGLDAAAKRVMWHTLAATVAGRSILLTTHSMEEADALASRAGIIAKRMLALGTTEQLRASFGDALHVHLICKGAPHTSEKQTGMLWDWIQQTFPKAVLEEKTYHGQMRFSVPARDVLTSFMGHLGSNNAELNTSSSSSKEVRNSGENVSKGAVGQLVVMLEENKERLGIEHYSVSPTTLDQVFLTIVGKHNVQEENTEEVTKKSKRKRLLFWKK